jgi:hypothetical protein
MPLQSTTLSTLTDVKKHRHSFFWHCGRPNVGHAKKLDIDGEIARLGPDYQFVGNTLMQDSTVCDVCKWKGGSITLHGPDRG